MLINGLDARTVYGFALDSPPGWLDAPPRQTPSAQVLKRGGARVLDKPRDQVRQVVLRGTIMGDTLADSRNKADALKLALCRNAGAQLTFEDQPTRYVIAWCEQFRMPPYGPAMLQNRVTVEATMTAHDPFSYDLDLAETLAFYTPGDAIPTETFTRGTVAPYFDVNGILQTAAINQRRDANYINGVRTALFEATARNDVLWNRDLTNAVWVGTNMSATRDQVGLDGAANTATRLTATAANATILQTLTQASALRSQSAYIRRNSGTGTVEMTMDGGTTWTVLPTPVAGAAFIKVVIPPQTLANPVVGFRLATSGSQVIVDFVQNEFSSSTGAQNTSPIATTTTGITRASDLGGMPFVATPQAMTVYAKFYELGLAQAAQRRILRLGNSDSIAGFLLYAPGSANNYTFRHHNGTTSITSSISVAWNTGDLIELRGVLRADGSVYIGVSVNGGAETAASPSTALALAPAWASTSLEFPTSTGSSEAIGLTEMAIVRGERSIAQLRAIAHPTSSAVVASGNEMPLGTGPVRPVLTLWGVAVNPTISLYNSVGGLVGTMALTVTTIASDVIVIDCDAKTIRLNGANRVDLLTSGDFFLIEPTDPNFDGTGPRFTSSSGALSVSYRRSWR